jgi:GAF domain-containing protein
MSQEKYLTLESKTVELWQQELNALRQRVNELEATLANQLQERSKELVGGEKQQQGLAKILEKVRKNWEIETIFQTTAEEVRSLLSCERVAVYQFNQTGGGKFVFESVAAGWKALVKSAPEPGEKILTPVFPYLYNSQESFIVEDVYQLLEQLQFRSYCVAPIFVGENQWGLIGAYQNSRARRWEAGETKFLRQIGERLGLALQQIEAMQAQKLQAEQLAKAVEREQAVAAVIDKIRRSLDVNTIFQTTVHEVRHLINADRVAIYQFNSDWSGKFVIESMASGWMPLLQKQLEDSSLNANISDCSIKLLSPELTDTYLQETAGGVYARGELFRVVDDIYQPGFSDCYLKLLESLQAKAYAIIAIYQGQRLWGLLAAYQNSTTRHWQEEEINFLNQIGTHFSIALQQAELFRQAQQRSSVLQTTLEAQLRQRASELVEETQREKAIAQVIDKIRQTLDIDTIFKTTATEVRRLLNADRVAMFRFIPDRQYCETECISEDVLPEYASALAAKIEDRCFGKNHAQKYKQGQMWICNDIYEAKLLDCHLAILGRFQVRANLVMPLLKGEKLWGLLCIHQCSRPRVWQEKEVEFVSHIAAQLSVAVQQAQLLAQAQKQSEELQRLLLQVQEQKEQQAKIAERERTFGRMIERIRLSLDIDTIFSITTQEVRQILKCDRVAFYRFKPGWDGEFVFESVAEGWRPFVAVNQNTVWKDTYLQENAGGRFRNHENTAINNIYTAGLSDCHIEILEQFQIKAYIVVPVFVGKELWGLLGAYQHEEPRPWEPIDASLLAQLGNQIGVVLQQAELLAQLKQAKETADAANRAKSDFLAHMSHELRTPLNAILGFTQLMSRDASLKPEQQENLSIINRSGEHLLTLINDVLEVSKIEAGQTILNENCFDLYSLIDSLQEMLELRASEKSLLLFFEREENVPQYICSDESKLRQVLINLLGNAIKFTQEGSVKLKVGLIESKNPLDSPEKIILEFEIEDTGLGISAEEIGKLFEAFAQTETGKRSQEGTGLGLRISRKFVHLMGGEISVTSQVGVGSMFKFHILVKPSNLLEIQTPKNPHHILGLEPGQPTYKILVVEDKFANRQLLVQLLKPLGFEVKEATNGEEAIALCQSWSPDLIWMDMRMPIMDGYAATKEIKTRLEDQAPTIIALTANAFEEERMIALSIGCDDFVRKPFQENVILEKIAEYLGVKYIYEESDRTEKNENKSPIIDDALPSKDLRILIAEDNTFNQKLALQMLKELGYKADVVASGTEVLAALKTQSYDLVLMDMKMPGMDGIESTVRIRRKWTNGIPRIIAMTASNLESDRAECLAAGMNDYITKPLRIDELKAALSQCFRSDQIEQNLPIFDPNTWQNLRSMVIKDTDTFMMGISVTLPN